MRYRIRHATPVSWTMEENGDKGEPELLTECSDGFICHRLPEGQVIYIPIKGRGIYAVFYIEKFPSGEIYTEWWSIEEIADKDHADGGGT